MSVPLFDLHCDTIVGASAAGIRKNGCQLDLDRLGKYGPCTEVFAVCTADNARPREKAKPVIAQLQNEISKNSDIVKLCLNFHDIEQAETDGKIAAIISVEGAEQLDSIESAFSTGVRVVHITWNYDNALSGAAMGSGGGLTQSGKDFVRKAQRMGVALDMSHISERGFWDTLEIAEKPVIAGHSNAAALCKVPRNLSDRQFCALVSIGGGAGINLCPDFLGYARDIDAVCAHIDHFLSLGGEKAVFLGCDFDGIDETPTGLSGVQDLDRLYEALLCRNVPESLVRDIFYYNARNAMRRMLL